jgi:hypothetical protein
MITEDQLEQLAIQWFQDTGWNYVHGAVIAPEGVAAEREDFRAARRRVAMPGRVLHGERSRFTGWAAPSGLGNLLTMGPRAMPWAVVCCPVGAEE